LPVTLAHVFAYRPAEDIVERLFRRNFLALLADDGYQFAFVLKELASVFRFDDRIAVGGERVVGAIVDVRPLREFGVDAAALG
jgi:hypothetical protein